MPLTLTHFGECAFGVRNPALRIGSAGWLAQKRAQVMRRSFGFATLQQQKGQSVVGTRQRLINFERLSVETDSLVVATGLGESDRHVLQYTQVSGVIPERETVGGQGGLVISLPLERQRLVEIIETLRLELPVAATSEEALPEAHPVREDTAALTAWQRDAYTIRSPSWPARLHLPAM